MKFNSDRDICSNVDEVRKKNMLTLLLQFTAFEVGKKKNVAQCLTKRKKRFFSCLECKLLLKRDKSMRLRRVEHL